MQYSMSLCTTTNQVDSLLTEFRQRYPRRLGPEVVDKGVLEFLQTVPLPISRQVRRKDR